MATANLLEHYNNTIAVLNCLHCGLALEEGQLWVLAVSQPAVVLPDEVSTYQLTNGSTVTNTTKLQVLHLEECAGEYYVTRQLRLLEKITLPATARDAGTDRTEIILKNHEYLRDIAAAYHDYPAVRVHAISKSTLADIPAFYIQVPSSPPTPILARKLWSPCMFNSFFQQLVHIEFVLRVVERPHVTADVSVNLETALRKVQQCHAKNGAERGWIHAVDTPTASRGIYRLVLWLPYSNASKLKEEFDRRSDLCWSDFQESTDGWGKRVANAHEAYSAYIQHLRRAIADAFKLETSYRIDLSNSKVLKVSEVHTNNNDNVTEARINAQHQVDKQIFYVVALNHGLPKLLAYKGAYEDALPVVVADEAHARRELASIQTIEQLRIDIRPTSAG